VRKGGNRVRITAQLIDAATGNHIWADRYDGELTDVFELQDEITRKVVAAIEPKLLEAESIRSQSRSPDDLGAWEMVVQAKSLFWRVNRTDGEAAIRMLKRAVERYPDYGPAHSMLAFMLLLSRLLSWSFEVPDVKQPAELAARAVELDDSDPWAHLAQGYLAFMTRRTDEAVNEFKRALDLNPNFAAAHGYMGLALSLAGRSEEAITHCEQALLMSPQDPQNAIFNTAIAAAHYLAGRYQEAIAFGLKAMQQRTHFTSGYRIYVASLAQAGRIEEAREALARLKELFPEMTIAWIEQYVPYTGDSMVKFIDGMRKAGLQ
jgi:tetratricopeptide (TPR) repeat protein